MKPMHLDTLTVMERAAVWASALARGDDAYADALVRTEPRDQWQRAHRVRDALFFVSFLYLTAQVARCALVWQWRSLRKDAGDDDGIGRVLCTQLVADADGWDQWCQTQGITPPGLAARLTGYAQVQATLPLARALRLPDEAMADWLAAHRPTENGDAPTGPFAHLAALDAGWTTAQRAAYWDAVYAAAIDGVAG